MEISGINLKTRELRQPHSIPNKQHMTPQLAPAWKELLLPNPRKVTAKHKLLLVSCSNSVFWRVCEALASASRTCALFRTSGLLSGFGDWDYQVQEAAWRAPGANRTPHIRPHTCSWQSSRLHLGCLHLQRTDLRAFRLLNVKDKVLAPQRVRPKHFSILWPLCEIPLKGRLELLYSKLLQFVSKS